MVKVIGTRFYEGGKLFFFDPGDEQPANGSYVLVDTVKGTDLAEVVMAAAEIGALQSERPVGGTAQVAAGGHADHDIAFPNDARKEKSSQNGRAAF